MANLTTLSDSMRLAGYGYGYVGPPPGYGPPNGVKHEMGPYAPPLPGMMPYGGEPPLHMTLEIKDTNRTGRWTLDEKILFLYGLRKFGKGRWKNIHIYLPKRSLVQIKSHAQKVLKRQDEGENIFRRLEDNRERMEQLVADVHERLGGEPPSLNSSPVPRRKRQQQPVEAAAVAAPKMTVEASIQTDPYEPILNVSVETSTGGSIIAQVPAVLPPDAPEFDGSIAAAAAAVQADAVAVVDQIPEPPALDSSAVATPTTDHAAAVANEEEEITSAAAVAAAEAVLDATTTAFEEAETAASTTTPEKDSKPAATGKAPGQDVLAASALFSLSSETK